MSKQTPLQKYESERKNIAVGDTVVITESFFNSFYKHCDSNDDIPKHNHGIVKSVITPRDRDEKGRYLHPEPNTLYLGMQDYVTFTLPNGEELSLFSGSLRKLY